MADKGKARIRCAIYTRKSTEDGLEQEYNSLDAQHDACAAYILSQRHEGWTLLPDRYDDGGFSGGTMERPGLKRLMAEVAAGRVDTIVIYKVDRLTRSLADFAKIVDVLDGAQASFVSVTQAFNTTTSMGRLTLNMLLSFAQFEREVTGERIRDKIAASKRKGLWMGGPVPLGYVVRDRKLIVEEAEAELVRHIYRRTLALGSVAELVDELGREGHRTKLQPQASGPHRGGCVFRRGTLFHLLKNRIYLGEIVHKGESHPGEHPAIVPQALWDEVQARLADRSAGGATRTRVTQPSMLTGLLTDGLGRSMTPTHAARGSRRYRYYVTRPDQLDGSPAWRVSAHDLEALVTSKLAEQLLDQHFIYGACGQTEAAALIAATRAAKLAAVRLEHDGAAARIALVRTLVGSVALREDGITIEVATSGLRELLGLEPLDDAEALTLTCDTVRVRRGHELRLFIPSGDAAPPPASRDEQLVTLVAEAHAARQLVEAQPAMPLSRVAAEAGRCRTRLTRLYALAQLAPDIVTTIVEGRQPASLTARVLLAADLPLEWAAQRKMLGIA